MASQLPCKKNNANGFTFYVSLVSQANMKIFQANPTLAAGDVKIGIDDGAPVNLNTLPAVDADFTKRVKVTLNQAETNGDNLTIIFSDAAGDEWCDLIMNIQTVTNQFDALSTAAALTTVDGKIDTVDTVVDAIKAKTDNLPASPAAVGSAMTLANDAITAAKFDETTAFPLKSADTGSTTVARTGADSDTLKTISDQVDGVATGANLAIVDGVVDAILVDTADMQLKLGTPVTSVSADIAAVKSDTAAVLIDTADIQPKIGTPVSTIAGDIAGVQADTDDIQSKIGAPVGASVSADIAAVKSQTAAIEADTQDIQTQIGTAGDGLTNLGGMSTTMRGQVNAEVDTALADYDAPTYAELTARTLPSADYFDPAADTVALVTKVNELGVTAKADVNAEVDQALLDYDSSNGVAKQSTVEGIQNNTRAVVSLPQPAMIPSAGNNVYRIDALHYDSTGNMEDADNNDIGLDLETSGGVDKSGLLYKEFACTNPLDNSGISGYKKLERTGVGRYFCFMKIASTEGVEQLIHMFAMDENAVRLYFTRNNNVLAENPGTATLADNATNKDIIAEALKERDVSGVTAVSGSIYKDVVDDIGDVQTDTTAILADTADMQPKLGTPVTSVSADIAAIKADTGAVLVDTADMQPKLGTPVVSISADIAAIQSDVDGITGDVGDVQTDVTAILADTSDMQPKLGTPVTSVSADIAAIKSDTGAILVDTADIQPKIGTPVSTIAGDIAGVQSDTDDIQAKIGTPVGASVSADIAAVKADTAAVLIDTADMQPKLGTPAVSISADIAAVKSDVGDVQSDVTDILADTADMQPKLGTPVTSIAADIAGVQADTDDIQSKIGTPAGASVSADIAAISGDIGSMQSDVDDILADTADMQPKIGTPVTSVSADIASVKSDTGAILVDTADMQPKIGTPVGTIAGDIAGVQSDTNAINTKLGAPAGASVSADVAAVQSTANTIESDVDAINVLVTAIDAVTSIIPDGGAMTSIARESTLATIISDIADTLAAVETVQTTLDNPMDGLTALKTAINAIPAETLASLTDGTKTLQECIRETLAYCAGKLIRVGNVYTYYNSAGTTPVFAFNATSTERTRV